MASKHKPEQETEYVERLVTVNRVAKVVKGGRRFGFSALVVVGDGKGKVGVSTGKAREVSEAVRKATSRARKSLVRVPLRGGRTLYHDTTASAGAGKIYLRPAPPGTGVMASSPMRAIFEALGVKDIVSKSIGTRNPYNVVRATMKALLQATSPYEIALKLGKRKFTLKSEKRNTRPSEIEEINFLESTRIGSPKSNSSSSSG